MGNCQAIDAASLVIQHPNGKEERLYWPVMAKEVMKSNPGHYVALLITFRVAEEMEVEKAMNKKSDTNHHHHHQPHDSSSTSNGGVRITRVKLLRPTDTLVLGQAYRLIDTQEVMKGLWAKKFAKMNKKKKELESTETTTLQKVNENQGSETQTNQSESGGEMMNQAPKFERHRQRTSSSSGGGGGALTRSRAWRPSLQSISEGQGVSQANYGAVQ